MHAHNHTHCLTSLNAMMTSKFYKLGTVIAGRVGLLHETQMKSFKHHFGINPLVCDVICERVKAEQNLVVSRLHLLWALYFLCCYPKVKTIRKLFEVDIKTFRKHTGKIILYVKNLKVVSVCAYFFICLVH